MQAVGGEGARNCESERRRRDIIQVATGEVCGIDVGSVS
jgi:hypothetical protein